jgi:hypothetical protein
MLNNIFLEEIIKAKLLDTRSKPANTSKLNEQLKFDSLRANILELKEELRLNRLRTNTLELKEQTDNAYLNKSATALKVVSPVVGGLMADPLAKLGSAALNKSSYNSEAAKRVRLQIKAATELQNQLNSTTATGLLDTPARQKEFMSYMRSKSAYDKLPVAGKENYFLQWKNTAADSFFKNIVKSSKGALTGVYKNRTNSDKQYYSYQILMVSITGKSRCVVQFHPDGTCNISDTGPLNISRYNYEIKGGKLYITQPDIDKWILKCTPSAYYFVAEFNPALNDKVFDPYKGAGFWKSAFLDLKGYHDENYWATRKDAQKVYNSSFTAVLDVIQTIGDWAGLIPGYGDIIDCINAIVYFIRGKVFEGFLSLIAIIPVIGSVVKIGVKNGLRALRVGNKVGLDAMGEIVSNPKVREVLLEYLRKNGVAREAVKNFVKNIHKASAWKGILTSAIRILRWIPGASMVGDALSTMLKNYGGPFEAYIKATKRELDEIIRLLDLGGDATNLGAKASREAAEAETKAAAEVVVDTSSMVGKELREQLIRNITSSIMKFAGQFDKFLYRLVGKEWFDTLSRAMANNFVKWANKLPYEQFIGLIKASSGGINLFIAALKTKQTVILEYFLSRNILSNIVKVGDAPAKQWSALTAYIRKADGAALEQIMSHVVRSFGKETEVLLDLKYRIVTSLISEGSAAYKIWCMDIWNILRGALPWAMHKWSTAKNISIISFASFKNVNIKYGLSRNLLTPATEPIIKLIDKHLTGVIGRWVGPVIKKFLNILDELTNLKRVDIIWNEVQEFFENTTGKDLSVNEKQSVILSFLSYCVGSLPYDLINWMIKIFTGVAPQGTVPVSKPTDIPFVKKQEFQKKLNAQ